MSTCLLENPSQVRVCLLPLLLPDGSEIPKHGAGSPESLPGRWTPKPRLQREVKVSQLDAAQACLVSEHRQGFPLRKKRKMAFGSQPAVSFDTSTDRKWAFQNLSVPQGRKHGRWLPARSLCLAALPHLLLVMSPWGLGRLWGSGSRG